MQDRFLRKLLPWDESDSLQHKKVWNTLRNIYISATDSLEENIIDNDDMDALFL